MEWSLKHLREIKANRIPDNLEMDVDSQFDTEDAESEEYEEEIDNTSSKDLKESDETSADLGSGWGRIIYMPMRRGKRVELDICRATNNEGTKGSFDRVVVTQNQNPELHHQARRSIWGELWPLRSGNIFKIFILDQYKIVSCNKHMFHNT